MHRCLFRSAGHGNGKVFLDTRGHKTLPRGRGLQPPRYSPEGTIPSGHSEIEGAPSSADSLECWVYRGFSFTRASAVVNRPSTVPPAALRRSTHAAVSRSRVARSGMRRQRYGRDPAPSSLSALGSPLPCFGGYRNSNRFRTRRASGGAKASYHDAGPCGFRWSMIRTIFFPGIGSSASSRRNCAPSRAVRRSVTFTYVRFRGARTPGRDGPYRFARIRSRRFPAARVARGGEGGFPSSAADGSRPCRPEPRLRQNPAGTGPAPPPSPPRTARCGSGEGTRTASAKAGSPVVPSPPYRFLRDALDDLPLHPTAGPQLPRPADPALGRGRTSQSHPLRLLRPVQAFRSAVLRPPAAEGGLRTLRNAALAQAFDRRGADAQAARDVDIPEVAAVAPFVRHQQNLRPTPSPGGSGTVDDRLEFPALRRRKAHSVELPALRVGQDPLRSPRRTPAGRLGSREPDPSDPSRERGCLHVRHRVCGDE